VAWYLWLVVALAFAGLEMATVNLIFLMLAVGGVAGALTSLATGAIVPEVVVAVAVSIGALVLVRPYALKHLQLPHSVRTGTAALVGAEGLVLERVDARDGRVKIGGEVWSAKAYDPTSVFEPGTSVEVARIDGATAIVYASES
jgi:membrane protein implicated in regulation of membrane protease activity